MLRINYITRPWFLDISVELIKALKHQVKLNVVLIITPGTVGYLGIPEEEAKQYLNKILPVEKVLRGEAYERFQHYFDGVTVMCKFEQHNEANYRNALGWFKYLNQHPDFLQADLHITETLSLADWYLLFKIRKKKIFYVVHDPIPHTGEGMKRYESIIKIYFPYINKFITYSEFSAYLFSKHFQQYKNKLLTFKMPVFNSQKVENSHSSTNKSRKKVVFFGRISPYKGVELFYEAASSLSEKYKNIDFIIAGSVIEGYNPYFLNHNRFENIIIKNHFISLKELYAIMNDAYLCVLPYLDATQSGVVMTSYAYDVPVLVSDCEGLLEYCFDRGNFSFSNNELNSLTTKLEHLINHPELIEGYQQKITDYKNQDVSYLNSNKVMNTIIPFIA